MRILKNRGDIYFSKSNKEKSKEQKILVIALIVIVLFTVLFVGIVSFKSDFSAKKFFAPDKPIDDVSIIDEQQDIILPEVSGKTNYAVMIKNDKNLLFTVLVQSDMDNKAFKVSALKADTVLDGQSLKNIFSSADENGTVNAIKTNLGIEIDYYMSLESSVFEDLFDSMGTVNYPILNDIRFRQNKIEPSFTLKLSAGEQSLDGRHFVNLMRYYLESENSPSFANELFLTAMTQQLNEENHKNSENLFRNFSANANTNITIRDFSLCADKLTVIASTAQPMNVYNVQAEYEENSITQEGLKNIKGYFVK